MECTPLCFLTQSLSITSLRRHILYRTPFRAIYRLQSPVTNMKYAFASAALLFINVLATPTPLGRLEERDPDTVNNLPDGDKDCNGNTYSPDNIKTAINFGWQANKDEKTYCMSWLLVAKWNPPQVDFEDCFRWLITHYSLEAPKGEEYCRISAPIHPDADEHEMVRFQPQRLRPIGR